MKGSFSTSFIGKRGREASRWSTGTTASSLSSSSAVIRPFSRVGSAMKPRSTLPSDSHCSTSW